jgi:hypothetical protein
MTRRIYKMMKHVSSMLEVSFEFFCLSNDMTTTNTFSMIYNFLIVYIHADFHYEYVVDPDIT